MSTNTMYKIQKTTPPVIFCVDWTIEFAKHIPEFGRKVQSKFFAPCDGFAFQLIASHEQSTKAEHDFNLVIYLQTVHPTPIHSQWSLSGHIGSKYGNVCTSAKYDITFDVAHSKLPVHVYYYWVAKSELRVTVRFELTSITRKGNSAASSNKLITQRPAQATQKHVDLLAKGLHQTLIDDSLLDFTLEVVNQPVEVKTLRCLLKRRSPVFKSMLQSDLRKAKKDRIVIEDFDTDTVKHMVAYIHTGTVDADLNYEANIQLLMIADKYDVSGLKKFASESLISQIDSNSICDILNHIVPVQNLDDLRHACGMYVSQNLAAIRQHDSCKMLSDVAKAFIFDHAISYM